MNIVCCFRLAFPRYALTRTLALCTLRVHMETASSHRFQAIMFNALFLLCMCLQISYPSFQVRSTIVRKSGKAYILVFRHSSSVTNIRGHLGHARGTIVSAVSVNFFLRCNLKQSVPLHAPLLSFQTLPFRTSGWAVLLSKLITTFILLGTLF